MVAGNNKGVVTLLSLEGEKIWDKKLHKAKCNFVQFSERQPWMMVTTSTGAGTGSVKAGFSTSMSRTVLRSCDASSRMP